MTAVELMGNAALPVMILVLGMQLERARDPAGQRSSPSRRLSRSWSRRLSRSRCALLGLSGPALHAGIIQASMPTAVVTTVLALEFELEPDFVTSVVVATTAISPFTLTLLIAYLQRPLTSTIREITPDYPHATCLDHSSALYLL